jgi:N-acetylneuraminic acid mutarotase
MDPCNFIPTQPLDNHNPNLACNLKYPVFTLLLLCLFSGRAQNWLQLSDFPGTARDDGVAFVIGDSAYFGTGLTPWWSEEGDFYGLDLTSGTWFNVTPLPSGEERQYACAFVSSSQEAYVFGGSNGASRLNDLWKYNPSSGIWTGLSSLPSMGRSGASCFVLNDTAFIVGGKTLTNQAIDEVWAYSIQYDTWVQKSNLPFGGRWRASAIEVNQTAYLIFGRDESNGFRNELYAYNPSLDTWYFVSNFPSPGRSHASMFEINNSLYVAFGIDSLSNSFNDLWSYDISLDSWQLLSSFPSTARRGGMAVNTPHGFYYATGIDANDQRLQETWKFHPSLTLDDSNGATETRHLIKIVDILGREVKEKPNTILFYLYDNGAVEKVYRLE